MPQDDEINIISSEPPSQNLHEDFARIESSQQELFLKKNPTVSPQQIKKNLVQNIEEEFLSVCQNGKINRKKMQIIIDNGKKISEPFFFWHLKYTNKLFFIVECAMAKNKQHIQNLSSQNQAANSKNGIHQKQSKQAQNQNQNDQKVPQRIQIKHKNTNNKVKKQKPIKKQEQTVQKTMTRRSTRRNCDSSQIVEGLNNEKELERPQREKQANESKDVINESKQEPSDSEIVEEITEKVTTSVQNPPRKQNIEILPFSPLQLQRQKQYLSDLISQVEQEAQRIEAIILNEAQKRQIAQPQPIQPLKQPTIHTKSKTNPTTHSWYEEKNKESQIMRNGKYCENQYQPLKGLEPSLFSYPNVVNNQPQNFTMNPPLMVPQTGFNGQVFNFNQTQMMQNPYSTPLPFPNMMYQGFGNQGFSGQSNEKS